MIPAHDAFAPDADPLVIRAGDNWGLFAEYAAAGPDSSGTTLAGLEPLWGFACPVAGTEPEQISHALTEMAAERRWQQIVLPGFPADLTLARRVAGPLTGLGSVGAAVGIVRQVAHVGDVDAWFGRRSPKFRRNLRRARRQADELGLVFTDASDDEDLVQRLIAIEARSWKGLRDDGLRSPELATFYRLMIERLQPRGECRALVAQSGGRDLGFIVGAVRNGGYRGFQLSFAEEARSLSLGHLLQWAQIEQLRGLVDRYDLGMDIAYKQAWADEQEETIVLVCQPPGNRP